MDFIRHTIALALANVEAGGRPFACIIVKDGEILAEGVNQVAQTHDPTAHAEIVAIRKAAAMLGSENFSGCDFYIMAQSMPDVPGGHVLLQPGAGVIFITRREDYSQYYTDDRKYFTLANFYDEFGKPWDEQALCRWPINLIPMELRFTSGGRN